MSRIMLGNSNSYIQRFCLLLLLSMAVSPSVLAQVVEKSDIPAPVVKGYIVPATVFEGDTMPNLSLPVVHIFKPLRLDTRAQQLAYRRLVRDVKKALPFAKIVSATLMETYEYMETLPTERDKTRHVRQLEKDLLKQFTPQLRKLTLNQGKLLIKLIERETGTSSYGLIDAFLGRLSAGFWNTLANTFGTSLKTTWEPEGEDAVIERVCIMVERGYI